MDAKIKTLLMFLMAIFMLAACREDEELEVYRRLRMLPPAEMEQRFTSLPPEAQIQLYVFGSSELRPPDLTLAPFLAKQGLHILPALVAELEKQSAGVDPQALVFVLSMMARQYQISAAATYGSRAIGWCNRVYRVETSCHEMARELQQYADRNSVTRTP